ncbi:SulP family inorganic anion transporter [Pseudonocardia hispaniensis]|uniref:SulP family inorganic anion transporter n=1 Tax=Pseudonocardia hispaniensis TaxID=904933 RepID=A0ABW1J0A8_9PSEU
MNVPSPAPQLLPFLRWLRGYNRSLLAADARAGATVGVLLIPQSMAYAALAGMPPITGLYAALASLVVYALLGTSNYSSVAPVAIDSLLVAAAVAPLAGGDQTRYVALAGLLAVLTGALQLGAGALRLGALVSFISVPVISGFTTAAALTIGASQLKDLLGVSGGGGSTSLLDTLTGLVPRLGETQPLTVVLGVGAIGALLLVRRVLPKAPGPLIVVTATALVALLPGLAGHVAVLGEVPAGLPVPALPSLALSDVQALLPSAAALALVSYLESVSTATAFARRTRTRVNPNGELIGVGAANVAAGFVRGFSVAAGFSRGAVNFGAGARTPMSGVLAAALIAVALVTLTPLLALMPKVALAAIIIVAVASLVDLRTAIAIARVRRSDLVALAATFLATLLLGAAQGLAVGVVVSLVVFLRQSVRPHFPELGRVRGTARFRNLDRHDNALTDPAVALFRLDAPLYFANSRAVADAITEATAERTALRAVVLDASSMPWVDFTGSEAIADLDEELREAGVRLHLAALRGPVTDVLARGGLIDRLRTEGRVHADVADAVAALGLDPDSPLRPGRDPWAARPGRDPRAPSPGRAVRPG